MPFVWQAADEILDARIPKQSAMRQTAYHLNEVDSALAANHPSAQASMKEHGIKFAIQYIALHDHCNPAALEALYKDRLQKTLAHFNHHVHPLVNEATGDRRVLSSCRPKTKDNVCA